MRSRQHPFRRSDDGVTRENDWQTERARRRSRTLSIRTGRRWDFASRGFIIVLNRETLRDYGTITRAAICNAHHWRSQCGQRIGALNIPRPRAIVATRPYGWPRDADRVAVNSVDLRAKRAPVPRNTPRLGTAFSFAVTAVNRRGTTYRQTLVNWSHCRGSPTECDGPRGYCTKQRPVYVPLDDVEDSEDNADRVWWARRFYAHCARDPSRRDFLPDRQSRPLGTTRAQLLGWCTCYYRK